VDFINYEDLEFRPNRSILDFLSQFPDIVNISVRGAVNFKDVGMVAVVIVDFQTAWTLIARLAVGGRIQAIDCLSKDTGNGGFPDASGSREQVGVRDAVILDRVLESSGNKLL